MEYHEAANIFPLEKETIPELAKDIKANGLLCPIETFEGKILDGRRRYLACKMAKVEPDFYPVKVPDPISYVLSLNLLRRHLSTKQRGIVAGNADRLYDELKKEAKEREKAGGKLAGRGRPQKGKEKLPYPKDKGQSRDKLGKQFNISGRTAERGRNVVKKGIPEVAEAVWKDNISLERAEKIAKAPKEEQQKRLREEIEKRRKFDQAPLKRSREKVSGRLPVATVRANEAIDILSTIPKNDPFRKRGFQMVLEWIRRKIRSEKL